MRRRLAPLEEQWYGGGPLAAALSPIGTLWCAMAAWRRRLSHRQAAVVPSIVVGNLSVGGSGKTPVAIALGVGLAARGWRPAILSRGYGGHPPHVPYRVQTGDDPAQTGDEALLIARSVDFPVYVGPQRLASAMRAAEEGASVVVLDDGFQHLSLMPDVALVLVQGDRPFGNGRCLPAGPLREPVSALQAADAVLLLDAQVAALPPDPGLPRFAVDLRPTGLHRLGDGADRRPLDWLRGREVTAVAGIARPERFFRTLEGLGAKVKPLAFPDHHPFRPGDLANLVGPVVMTAKDGVKCPSVSLPDAWVLELRAELPPVFWDWLEGRLAHRRPA